MSLAKELGRDYMDQFYNGSYFTRDGKIYKYVSHSDSGTDIIAQTVVQGPTGALKWEGALIPSASITNMDDFAWPKLGYRDMTSKNTNVSCAYFVSTTRSAMRGLKYNVITYNCPTVARYLDGLSDPKMFLKDTDQVQAIFFPQFLRFDQALDKIKSGDACAVALNEDLAIALSVDQGPNKLFDVLYKDNIVGYINDQDEVVVPRKLAKRASTLRAFQGRVRL